MIKIIKEGKNCKRETCPVCKCVFEYEQEDLVFMEDASQILRCPNITCRNPIVISSITKTETINLSNGK